jgi:hypothetical protein
VLREIRDFGAVAGFGGPFPFADNLKIGDFLQPCQDRFTLRVVDFLAAGVVGPAFHVADAKLIGEVLLQEGNVFEEELFLKVLRAGGNDDALTGQDRGHQVGE